MKKNISRNPLWPDWYNGKKIDEVQFGRAFLEQWPLKCVNGTLYTLDGPVEDESEIKQRILENIEEYVTSGLSKKVTNILETIKLLAFSDPFPIEQHTERRPASGTGKDHQRLYCRVSDKRAEEADHESERSHRSKREPAHQHHEQQCERTESERVQPV